MFGSQVHVMSIGIESLDANWVPVQNRRDHDPESDEIGECEVEHQGRDELDRRGPVAGEAAGVEQQRHHRQAQHHLVPIKSRVSNHWAVMTTGL